MKNCPTKEMAKGYDILIWMEPGGEILCCGYTTDGEEFLRDIEPTYNNGDVLELLVSPQLFELRVYDHLRIGGISPRTNKVHPFTPGLLH